MKGRRKWAAAGILLAAALALQVLARYAKGFADWYGANVYPRMVFAVGGFFSVFPFSAAELGIYLFLAWIALYTVLSVIHVYRGGFRVLKKYGATLALTASALLLIFTLFCGINYHSAPFSENEGFSMKQSSKEELRELCAFLAEEINRSDAALSGEMDRYDEVLSEGTNRSDAALSEGTNRSDEVLSDEANYRGVARFGETDYGDTGPYREGDARFTSLDEMERQAVLAMKEAGKTYESLSGFTPHPKAVWQSGLLSKMKIMGIYSPFTIEANYNREMPVFNIPSTLCHELSHLKGYMREDEANFVAWLACMASDQPQFTYSGHMLAFSHAMNALWNAGEQEAYREIYAGLCQNAKEDLQKDSAFWHQYDGKAAEVSQTVNDTYLKLNSQDDGVKSYGRMVDLLLAYIAHKDLKNGS